ncbi:DExH-box ATP-dependent RNA helicase DExH6 [Linum perenne]
MQMLHGMRKHLQGELIRNGFIPENVSSCSSNARDPGIIRAVLVASVYPNVGKLLPLKNGKHDAKVRLHPHSLNFRLATKKSEDCPLVIYDEVTRGDGGMHIRNCTVVGPLSSALLATEIGVAPANGDDDEGSDDDDDADTESDEEDGMEVDERNGVKVMSAPDNSVVMVLDRWLLLGSSAIDVAQIYCLRERLSAAILFKVSILQHELDANFFLVIRANSVCHDFPGNQSSKGSSTCTRSLDVRNSRCSLLRRAICNPLTYPNARLGRF